MTADCCSYTISPGRSLLPLVLVGTVVALLAILLVSRAPADTAQAQMARTKPIAEVPDWIKGRQVEIEPGLTLVEHTDKHRDSELFAAKTYSMLQNHQCVASIKYCKGGKTWFICIDPVTGTWGGLLQIGKLIKSGYGYGGETTPEYWFKKMEREGFKLCK